MTDRLRIAVVGAGVAGGHLHGLAPLSDRFEVVELCALDEDRGRKLAADFGVPGFGTDFDALLARDDIDVIAICTPPHLHFDMIEKVLRAGKHAVCEKPLVGSLAACDRLSEIAAETGRSVMPVFQYRYGAGMEKLRRLVDAGLAGRPYMATVETHWWRDKSYFDVAWRGTWETELGGGFLGHATHAHDMLTEILGPVAEIGAMGGPLMNDIEVEDNMVAAARMQNGALATLSMTLSSRKEISRLRFCFEDLTVESSLHPYAMYRDPWVFTGKDAAHQKAVDAVLAAHPDHADGYQRQYELMHAALAEGGELPVTLADARHALEIVTGAYWSNRSGQRQALPIGADHDFYEGWAPR